MKIDHTRAISPVQQKEEAVPVKKARETSKKEAAAPVDKVEIRRAAPGKTAGAKNIDPNGTVGESPKDIVVMREGGLKALCDAIDGAKENIDIKIYIITTTQKEVMDSLKGALKRGVNVRLMVEDDPFYWKHQPNPSQTAIDELVKAGAGYKPDNPKFSTNKVTHEKTITIDSKEALILTGNLGASTFNKNLDIGAIVVKNPDVVGQVKQVFNSDWDRTDLPEMKDVGLVVSPENARAKLTQAIQGAKSDIHILQQSITDKEMLGVISDQIKKGVKTEVLLTDPAIAQNNMQPAAFLATHGAKVRYLETPYIHAKAMSIDQEDKTKTNDISFIGSQNFSFSALQRNREMGYIFNDKSNEVEKIFDQYNPKGYDIPSKQITSEGYVVGSSIGSAIRMAEKSIILQTNLFSDAATNGALCKAVERGVDVKVMIPKNPFPWDPTCDLNTKTAEYLKSRGVDVKFIDSTYKSVQGTTMVIDDKEALVGTENISYSAFKKNISFGVIDIDPKEVKDVADFLKADWEGKASGKEAPVTSSELVVSPQNARSRLIGLMKDAKKSINLETIDLTDKEALAVLKEKAKAGVAVQVVVSDNGKMPAWKKDLLDDLAKAGAKVELYSKAPLRNNYLNIDSEKAYIGGHSLDKTSLDEARSFGLVATHPQMLKIAESTFHEHAFTASVDQAKESIQVSKKAIKFPADRMMLDNVLGQAKYGVKIDIETSNPHYSFFDVEIQKLNDKLVEISKLDPQKDKDKIAEYYDLKFEPDEAVTYHGQLVKAIKALEKGKNLVTLTGKPVDQIKEEKIIVDNKITEFPEVLDKGDGDKLKAPGTEDESSQPSSTPSMSWNIKLS
ncbi:MAG: phospholipase D-like domain-containing protein [Chloroflexi bacterium]|nr:phospholipase D-like domain-containing protein [Chloroflexota bacterium]